MSAPEKAPEKEEPAKAPAAPVITDAPKAPEAPKAPAKAGKAPAKKAEPKPAKKAEAKPAKKADAKAAAPTDRKALEAMVEAQGAAAALEALSKVKVVDLRALAREYNGEFGIAGREIRNANKKVLIEEFRKFFS